MAFSASFSNITSNSAKFKASFSGGDDSFARYRYVELTIYDFGTYEIRSFSSGGSSSSFSKTINGLDQGTVYEWEAILGYEESDGEIVWLSSVYDDGTFETSIESAIEPWNWNSSNGSATAKETQLAYDVLMGTETCEKFSHKVWNDLVDKVMEIRGTVGDGTWDKADGKYLSYANSKVSKGDTLSADIYNAVRYNIGSITSTGISDVKKDDTILTGYHIYHLTEVINDYIDSL